MKVIVEARNGMRAGHRVWLSLRQQLRVGRTEWADFSVPDDREMADVHFQLECSKRACQVRNLVAGRPLFVNGQRVEQQTLVDGDIIRAGSTDFLVTVHLERDDAAPVVPLLWRRGQPTPILVRYKSYDCLSGVVCCSGLNREFPVDELVRLVNMQQSMYVLVQPEAGLSEPERRAGLGLTGSPLVTRSTSRGEPRDLRLFGPGADVDRHRLIEEHWKSGAATVLFTGRETDAVAMQIARNPHLQLPPVELVKMFFTRPNQKGVDLLAGLGAVLLPVEETHWGLFSSPRHLTHWERLGLPNGPENDLRSVRTSEVWDMSAMATHEGDMAVDFTATDATDAPAAPEPPSAADGAPPAGQGRTSFADSSFAGSVS